jgi:hypothetical protein
MTNSDEVAENPVVSGAGRHIYTLSCFRTSAPSP